MHNGIFKFCLLYLYYLILIARHIDINQEKHPYRTHFDKNILLGTLILIIQLLYRILYIYKQISYLIKFYDL